MKRNSTFNFCNAKIIQGYNDVKLVIAGKGGMLDDLKAQAEAMGIANKIYFTGYLNAKQVQKYINVLM